MSVLGLADDTIQATRDMIVDPELPLCVRNPRITNKFHNIARAYAFARPPAHIPTLSLIHCRSWLLSEVLRWDEDKHQVVGLCDAEGRILSCLEVTNLE